MAVKQIKMGKAGLQHAPIVLIAGDSDTQIVQLNVQRYDGGVDLAPLSWLVTVENATGATEEYPIGETVVTSSVVTMQWRVKGTATAAAGITRFKLTGCTEGEEGNAVVWQSGECLIRIDDTIAHTPGSEEQQALTEVQQLIVYVDGELPGVVQAGKDAAAAAEAATQAADDANAAAEEAREAAKVASTGIESVEQTKTSEEDYGVNEITVTLSDGQTSTFQIRNGRQGSPGTPGTPGEDGTSVTITDISGSTEDEGENIITFSDGSQITVRNGSQGIQGEQGPEGVKYKGAWSGGKLYDVGEAVSFDGSSYIVKKAVTVAGTTPPNDENHWALLAKKGDPGLVWKGEWTSSAIYGAGSVVMYAGTAYVCTSTSTSASPADDAANWQILASKGSQGAPGNDGEDGVSCTHAWDGTTLSVTSASGTTSANLKGATGEQGVPGTSIHRITTAPSAYTTTTGGFTPAYRIALSTVLTQSLASSVAIGDMIVRNYYTYLVGYVDANYVYLGSYASIRGSAGTSVTVSSVSENTESGGTSTVNFSDGKTLSVKNGKDGAAGATADEVIDKLPTETWTFTLSNGTEVPKTVPLISST